jgi:3-oxoadipate enol-lactonase
MPLAPVGDTRLYYEVHGRGPQLLFLNGTNGDLRVRPNIFDTPLAADFEILAFDQRGLGQSDKPPGPYTMDGYADDAALLLDHVGWSR